MRRYSGTLDWFRCDGCGHLFTFERVKVLEILPSQNRLHREEIA
jgi:hypothetical protein